jgi:hypothetical protein
LQLSSSQEEDLLSKSKKSSRTSEPDLFSNPTNGENELNETETSTELTNSIPEIPIPFLCDMDSSIFAFIEELMKVEQTEFFPNALQQSIIGPYETVWKKYGFKYFTNQVEAETHVFLEPKERKHLQQMQSKGAYYEKDYSLPDWDLVHIKLHAVVEIDHKEQTLPFEFWFSPYASSYCYEHIIKPKGFSIQQLIIVRYKPTSLTPPFLHLFPKNFMGILLAEQSSLDGIWSDKPPIFSREYKFTRVSGTYMNGWGLTNSTSPSNRYVQYFRLTQIGM